MPSRSTNFICVFVSFWILLLTLPASAQYRGADRPRIVVVESLSFEYETLKVEAVGTAQAKHSVTLFASASDEVISLNFLPGQEVKKADVLLKLDSRLQDVSMHPAICYLI
jgi:multidrug efflux pump subunit AcrA (membrane-fusion protein)